MEDIDAADKQLLSDSAFLALRFALAIILLSSLFPDNPTGNPGFCEPAQPAPGPEEVCPEAGNAIILALSFLLREPIAGILGSWDGKSAGLCRSSPMFGSAAR